MMFRYRTSNISETAMPPIESNLSVGSPGSVSPENFTPARHNPAKRTAEAEMPATVEALQQILDRPDLHSIGDFAALTDRLISEMMLFNALIGGSAAQFSHDAPAAALAAAMISGDAAANDAQMELLAEFLRDLEG
jgi:hypothetical protein